MKKFLLSLMAILAVVGVRAQVELTWTASTDWAGSQADGYVELTQGDYIVRTEGGTSTLPTINASKVDMRAYAGATVTISAGNGKEFTKVVFNISDAGKQRLASLTADKGEITYDGIEAPYATVTWQGEATNNLVITVGANSDYGTTTGKAGQFDIASPIVITEPVPPVMIETDLTGDFGALTNWRNWTGATGYTATNYCPAVTTNAGQNVQVCERYDGNCNGTGDIFYQTVSGLTPGTYKIELYGGAAYTFGRGFTSTAFSEGTWNAGDKITENTGVTLYAETSEGTLELEIPIYYATNFPEGAATVVLDGVKIGSNGQVKLGMKKTSTSTNWHVIQLKGVTALVNAADLLASTVAKAEAIAEADVPAALYTEIQNVLTENNKDYEDAAGYEAAIAAIDAVVAKATPYAPLAAVLAQGEAVKANVPAENEAIATYDAAIADVKAAYDAVTVTDFDAAIASVKAALLPLAKAQTANNSDMTIVVENATWTCDQGNGPNPYSTGTETYVDHLPGGVAGKVMYQRIEGLPMGNYEVSFYAVANSCWIGSASGDGISQVFANEATLDIPVIAQTGCTPTDYLRTLTAIVGEDGVLEYGIQNVADGGNWFVAQVKSLTLVKAITDATELYYEKAMASIKDGQTYRVFTTVGENKFYLNAAGYLVNNAKKAATFTFNKVTVSGTLYESGWDLGCKFTNPSLTGGQTGDVVQQGHIIVGGNNRNDWERQVFFLKDGKYAVRATNANSVNWGAATYWTVTNTEAELPNADYQLEPNYVFEIEENVDNRPEAFAKVKTWAYKLQQVEGLVNDKSQWSSNAGLINGEDGQGFPALYDGNGTTYFHTAWNGSGVADPGEDHYIQAELPDAVDKFYIYFYKRGGNNNNNRPTKIDISAGNDATSLTAITSITEGLPTAASVVDYTSGLIDLGATYNNIRFTVPETNSGNKYGDHVFFSFGEFYILPSNEVTDAAAPFMAVADYTDLEDTDIETINAIDEQIAALVAQKELAEDINALGELADKLQAKIDATETYTDEANVAATVSAALAEIKGATYTTAEEIEAAKAQLKAQADAFFGGIKAVEDIDITEFYIINATPTANVDGWTTSVGATTDAANNCAEFWNAAGATIKQTINLPAGDFKLIAQAFTRSEGSANGFTFTDMHAYLNAGEANTTIALVSPTEVNGRGAAKTWFDNGNGYTELPFTVETAGDVEIGLTADNEQQDYWMVWRGFQLILAAPAPVELAQEINIERYTGKGYDATTFEPDFTEGLAFLGIENVTDATLTFINPDDTEVVPTFGNGTPDGWCDETGALVGWGDNSKICVKFNIADADYMVCDMNGADVAGTTYTVKYALSANGKKVIYTINVTFVEKVVTIPTEISDLVVEATVEYDTEGNYVEKVVTLADEQVQSILTELGISSLDEADVLGYNPTTSEFIINFEAYDGWRNADGDFAMHTGNETVPFCVKYTDGVTYLCYNIASAEYHEYAAYWAISNGTKAVLVKINFVTATAINGVEADTNKAEVIFDLAGRRINKAQKGIYIINGKKVAVK